MALQITPSKKLDPLVLGEEIMYTLDCRAELGTNTVFVVAYTVWDASGDDVTVAMSGGSSEAGGLINFGVKAAVLGTYALKFIVTCNEVLPDATTPYEFFARLNVTVKDF